MHTEPIDESEGEFTSDELSLEPCPQCGGPVRLRHWESTDGAYEDEKLTCTQCGKSWWVEGPDA